MSFISEEQAMAALEWLDEHADEAAEARAHKVYLDLYRPSLKSIIMKESDGDSGVIQERNALADPRYIECLQASKDATFNDAKMQYLRGSKEKMIDVYQTQSANRRGMKF